LISQCVVSSVLEVVQMSERYVKLQVSPPRVSKELDRNARLWRLSARPYWISFTSIHFAMASELVTTDEPDSEKPANHTVQAPTFHFGGEPTCIASLDAAKLSSEVDRNFFRSARW
jgi:hypothetical protein